VESTAIRADFSPERELEGPDWAKKFGYRTFWPKHRQDCSPPARDEPEAHRGRSASADNVPYVELEAYLMQFSDSCLGTV
jgi:hypothetical protein